MARRATWQGPSLATIAEAAGVSASTVDRVLNARPNVSNKARIAVVAACQELGLSIPAIIAVNGEAATPASVRHFRVGMVSDAGPTLNERLATLVEAFNAANEHDRIITHLQNTKDFEIGAFVQTINLASKGVDGLIVNCRDDHLVRRAIDEVTARGIPVVCLSTDLPDCNRLVYIGMNQFSAGATAASLIGRFTAGRAGAVVLSTSAPYVCQEQRESGFRRLLRTSFPHLVVQESINSQDDVVSAYEHMGKLLESIPDPVAVYNVAGGNPGIAAALKEAGLKGRTVFIGHEGSESSMRLLEADEMDAVIVHSLDEELRRAVAVIRTFLANEPIPEALSRVTQPTIVLKQMLT